MNRVLLIENENVGEYYKSLLEKSIENLKVCWVRGKKSAFESLDKEDFKIVIFDQRLDNGELGTSIMREIKKKKPDLVGLMISAYSMPNDTTEAIKKGILFEYINKDNIEILPAKVVDAIRYYNVQKAMLVEQHKEYIGKIYRKYNIFHPLKLYITNKILIDSRYTFEDTWEELYIINAGEEQCYKKSIEITNSIKVEIGYKEGVEADLEFDKITNLITTSFNSNVSFSSEEVAESCVREVEEIVKTFKMPPIPQAVDEDYLTTIIFEGTQIFKKYQVILSKECTNCKMATFFSVYVFVPTNGKKLRKINTYKSGEQEIIEVSSRI